MTIIARGYLPASFLLEREPGRWHALVILDSGKRPTDFVKTHAQSYCYLSFDDVEQAMPSKQQPTEALIRQGMAFAKGKEPLLVVCRAGQGRSVALSYVICCQERG